jgi:hypothetical protein
MAKLSKQSVDYSKGTPEDHCGVCEYYEHGACRIVDGEIDPNYWCERFKPGLRGTIIKAAMYKGPNE